jgi:RHS repeat-associated protein
VTWLTHSLNGTNRNFNYGYYDDTDDLKFVRRLGTPQGDIGDVFGYDQADQVIGVALNVPSPSATPTPTPNVTYDSNGNRTTFRPYGPIDSYTVNDLNQYVTRNNVNAIYDLKGNMTAGFDGSTYQYDAQNRLTRAINNGVTTDFKYDGLNRQVSRSVTGQPTKFSMWDGWDLVEEYHMSGNNAIVDARYLHGPTGLVKNLTANRYYYQDGSGSTSHLANSNGNLLEWYRYDLQGTPIVSDDPSNNVSAYGVRHLFTGQQWYSELGLYDLRNRFYSPDIGRFLQPDPIGFRAIEATCIVIAGTIRLSGVIR